MQFAYFMIIIFDNFSLKILFINLLHINYYNSELTKAEIWLYMELANEWFFSTPPLFWNEMKIREVRAHARVSLCRKKKNTLSLYTIYLKNNGRGGVYLHARQFYGKRHIRFSFLFPDPWPKPACLQNICTIFTRNLNICIFFFMGHQICVFQMLQKKQTRFIGSIIC